MSGWNTKVFRIYRGNRKLHSGVYFNFQAGRTGPWQCNESERLFIVDSKDWNDYLGIG